MGFLVILLLANTPSIRNHMLILLGAAQPWLENCLLNDPENGSPMDVSDVADANPKGFSEWDR